jgi:hypothetical protein
MPIPLFGIEAAIPSLEGIPNPFDPLELPPDDEVPRPGLPLPLELAIPGLDPIPPDPDPIPPELIPLPPELTPLPPILIPESPLDEELFCDSEFPGSAVVDTGVSVFG